jgi:hypothetical protein
VLFLHDPVLVIAKMLWGVFWCVMLHLSDESCNRIAVVGSVLLYIYLMFLLLDISKGFQFVANRLQLGLRVIYGPGECNVFLFC